MEYKAKLNEDGTYTLYSPQEITNFDGSTTTDYLPIAGSFTLAGITNEIADFQRAMDDDNAKLTAMQAVPLPEPTPVVDTPDAPLSTNSEQ